MAEPRKIQIAVSGGGLAGAAIARALYQQAHIQVNVYESASEFSKKGMAIGMAINAQRALGKLVPDVEEMFQRAGAVTINSSRIMLAAGPHAGMKVIDVAEEKPGKMMHRAALLHELLEPIPKDRLQASKKLAEIKQQEEGLLLKFEDGSKVQVDALIGADGIFGSVRAHVLGADHEAVKPVAAGWAGAMNMVPYPKAEAKIGAEILNENRQFGWVGDGGIFIHDSIMGGKMVQCIGTSVDRDTSGARRIPIDREYMDKAFASCLDGPVAKGMIDLLLDQESPAVFAQYEHTNAPTYVKGRVCIAGDAAHAMTPWQGSGAATALEDAVILGTLFEQIRSPDEVEQVFKTYDAVRRPRSQRIAESSRQTGRILSGIADDIGLDPVKMHDALKDRWSFIHDFDLDGHVESAKASFKDKS
ncbi:Nn.00g112540.m01.CDS01 [Neocucurbitaria sp. VM-36]